MPLIGFENDEGQRVTFEECWRRMKDFGGLPVEVLYRIYLSNRTEARPDGLTVTGLLGCSRKAFLQRRMEYYDNPRFLYALFRGTIVHGILEDTNQLYQANEIISERRYHRKVPGTEVVLSGKIDRYVIPTETLEDYKTIADEKVPNLLTKLPEDYVWQTNMYKWILEDQGVSVKNLRIRFFSWKYCFTSGTEVAIPAGRGEFLRGRIPDCPVLRHHQIEDFIVHRVKDITRGDMPPAVDGKCRWMCNRCPFAKTVCWREDTNAGR